MMMLGRFPSSAMIVNLDVVSSFPTTSVIDFGLYFSTQGSTKSDFGILGVFPSLSLTYANIVLGWKNTEISF